MTTLNVEAARASDFRVFREVLQICREHGLSGDTKLELAHGSRAVFRACQESGIPALESYEIALQIFHDDLQLELQGRAPERDHWGDPLPSLGEPTAAELLPDVVSLATRLKRGEKAAQSRRKLNRKPVSALSGFPLLAAHLDTHDGYYPDAMVDTRRKRQRESREVAAVLYKLDDHYPEGLKLYRISLPELDHLNLYDHELVRQAKKRAERWLKARGVRGWFKVERGRHGGTHVHIVTSASAAPGGTPVYDLAGLAAYLVKPADGRACMRKRDEDISAAELKRQKDAAAEYWLAARAALAPGQRLPRFRASCTPRGIH